MIVASGDRKGVDSAAVLARVMRDVDRLPPLPAVVTQIVQATAQEEASIDRIAELIASDPSMATRVLRLANSPQFRRSKQIDSVRDAVGNLGLDQVRAVAVGMGMLVAMNQSSERVSKFRRTLWLQGFARSYACGLVLSSLESDEVRRQPLSLAALLQDIGRTLIASSLGELYLRHIGQAVQTGVSSTRAEFKLLGLRQGAIGQRVCRKWEVPDSVLRLVGVVDMPEPPERVAAQEHAALVLCSDMARRSFPTSLDQADRTRHPALREIDLAPEVAASIRRKSYDYVRRSADAIERL